MLIERILCWLKRPSDIVVGDSTYMRRWIWYAWRDGPCLRVHHILRPDRDRALHDHPFDFLSWIVRGGYYEERPKEQPASELGPFCAGNFDRPPGGSWVDRRVLFWRRHLNFCRAEQLHRISDVSPGGVWTIVLAGRRRRHWGFQTALGWVPWERFEPEAGTWDSRQDQLNQRR